MEDAGGRRPWARAASRVGEALMTLSAGTKSSKGCSARFQTRRARTAAGCRGCGSWRGTSAEREPSNEELGCGQRAPHSELRSARTRWPAGQGKILTPPASRAALGARACGSLCPQRARTAPSVGRALCSVSRARSVLKQTRKQRYVRDARADAEPELRGCLRACLV
jgi:hypothetical protein